MSGMSDRLLRRCGHAMVVISMALTWAPAPGAQSQAPRYEVDASWPKPFPDRWVFGGLAGVCVDGRDHVFILNRQDVLEGDLNAGRLAPPIIELDAEGTLINSWGDAKLLDPRLHSCYVDADSNIWIASTPSGMVQKYSHDGSALLFQIGTKGVLDSSDGTAKGTPLNSNAARFFMPSSLFVDPKNGDVYVSDGESRNGNRRIVVIDRRGTFLRQWQPEGMQTVHCMTVSADGWVYVCNREASRIQVYDKTGAFAKNIDVPWKPYTPPANGDLKESGGSVVSIELSRDAGQRWMYVINQNNSHIEIIERASGKILSTVGRGAGHFSGQFDQPHGLAVDSRGDIYVTENRGKRIQKFKVVSR